MGDHIRRSLSMACARCTTDLQLNPTTNQWIGIGPVILLCFLSFSSTCARFNPANKTSRPVGVLRSIPTFTRLYLTATASFLLVLRTDKPHLLKRDCFNFSRPLSRLQVELKHFISSPFFSGQFMRTHGDPSTNMICDRDHCRAASNQNTNRPSVLRISASRGSGVCGRDGRDLSPWAECQIHIGPTPPALWIWSSMNNPVVVNTVLV
ncbi:hypothetical protein V8F06_009379 [Rhypophila decipiens]